MVYLAVILLVLIWLFIGSLVIESGLEATDQIKFLGLCLIWPLSLMLGLLLLFLSLIMDWSEKSKPNWYLKLKPLGFIVIWPFAKIKKYLSWAMSGFPSQ